MTASHHRTTRGNQARSGRRSSPHERTPAHVPSFADTWGWQLCFTEGALAAAKAKGGSPLLPAEKLDEVIAERFGPSGLSFLDGEAIHGVAALNKGVRTSLANETGIYTVDNPKFIHGQGINDQGRN